MSETYEHTLDAVRREISFEPGTPEQMMEERVARLVEEMTDISILAMQPDQRPLVSQQFRGVAQILLRSQLILSVLEGKEIEALRRLIAAVVDPATPLRRVS